MALFLLQALYLMECAFLIQFLKLCPGPVGNFPGKFFDIIAARSGVNNPVEVAFHFKEVSRYPLDTRAAGCGLPAG